MYENLIMHIIKALLGVCASFHILNGIGWWSLDHKRQIESQIYHLRSYMCFIFFYYLCYPLALRELWFVFMLLLFSFSHPIQIPEFPFFLLLIQIPEFLFLFNFKEILGSKKFPIRSRFLFGVWSSVDYIQVTYCRFSILARIFPLSGLFLNVNLIMNLFLISSSIVWLCGVCGIGFLMSLENLDLPFVFENLFSWRKDSKLLFSAAFFCNLLGCLDRKLC